MSFPNFRHGAMLARCRNGWEAEIHAVVSPELAVGPAEGSQIARLSTLGSAGTDRVIGAVIDPATGYRSLRAWCIDGRLRRSHETELDLIDLPADFANYRTTFRPGDIVDPEIYGVPQNPAKVDLARAALRMMRAIPLPDSGPGPVNEARASVRFTLLRDLVQHTVATFDEPHHDVYQLRRVERDILLTILRDHGYLEASR